MSRDEAPPPRDHEAERAVIAGLLDGADLVGLGLRIEAFPDHQPLVEVIAQRFERGERVDRDILRVDVPALAHLLDELPAHDAQRFAERVEIVGDLDKLRRLIDAAHDMADVVEAQDRHRRKAHTARRRARGLSRLRRQR